MHARAKTARDGRVGRAEHEDRTQQCCDQPVGFKDIERQAEQGRADGDVKDATHVINRHPARAHEKNPADQDRKRDRHKPDMLRPFSGQDMQREGKHERQQGRNQ